jgi:transmembrane 9 superfamily protein 2/4
MIVLFLAGMVAAIMLRTLRRDISAYNALDAEEAAEESGWKLVHGDVFRPPPAAEWLAALTGAGAQLLLVAVATIGFAALGFLSPANRGGLTTAALLFFALSGSVAGYASARVYKRFRGGARRSVALRAALAFPAAASVVFLSVNAAAAAKRSSGAAPFGTLAALLFLWGGVNAPLALLGAYLGGRGPPPEDPVRTNKIPRQVPPQPWFVHPALAAAVGGVLPFGAVFIELFFILAAAWTGTFYYLFGFLALAFAVLVATCAEVTVVLAYFQLCAEDYRWAWRAFLTSGASAGYLFAYSAYYFVAKLDIAELAPAAVYFGYMAIFSAAFFLLTGAVGFFATAVFVRRVYSALKID